MTRKRQREQESDTQATQQDRYNKFHFDMAEKSKMYLLCHINEFTAIYPDDPPEMRTKVEKYRKYYESLIQTIIAMCCKICAPNTDSTNSEEIKSIFGPALTMVMTGIANNRPEFCDNMIRKMFVFFCMGSNPDIMDLVANDCKDAPEWEKSRVKYMVDMITIAAKQVVSAGMNTQTPIYSPVETFVKNIQLMYAQGIAPVKPDKTPFM